MKLQKVISLTLISFLFVFNAVCSESDSDKDVLINNNPEYVIAQQGLLPDPSFDGCADTYVDSAHPDTNYGNSGYATMGTSSGYIQRAIIKFNIGTLPIPTGAIIQKAFLSVYVYGTNGLDYYDYACYKVQTSWNEDEATWNNRISATGWNNAGGDYGDMISDVVNVESGVEAFGIKKFTLDPEYIQDCLDNPFIYYGIMIKAVDEDSTKTSILQITSSDHALVESRPRLTIYFSL